uniref:Uncharacterized protein n=1 Tax=Arundo donax TaxID=35708 RepID=A0A0A8ZQZ7_ARUDO
MGNLSSLACCCNSCFGAAQSKASVSSTQSTESYIERPF